ncbi:hypothetical protein AMAG_01072 [Allomyces macrogynus ATCC 38327]|uniref:F-box domain-containing protein n=1 Tax=Allomyces macrogynus (strain ATCC 38327) TaxID=578462 RepID=A0A0L0RYI8_ALLM3|nr:hypothetical protein AMAG_01072 [Allomyces macrogynus ATCC 38327]|eukprot:KNE55149.1 hypothetical protein AMAG_01072 [Allomyces macrogynus ATCC 38327]
MEQLPCELLDRILSELPERDLVVAARGCREWYMVSRWRRSLVVRAVPAIHDINAILRAHTGLHALNLVFAGRATRIPPNPISAKTALVQDLHRISEQFAGHPTLRHVSVESDLALRGVLNCPQLESLNVDTSMTYDVQADMTSAAALGTSPGMDWALEKNGRNIAHLLQYLPKLRKLTINRPIFFAYPIEQAGAGRARASHHVAEDPFSLVKTAQAPRRAGERHRALESLEVSQLPMWSLINMLGFIRRGYLPHLTTLSLEADLHMPHGIITSLSVGCPTLRVLRLQHIKLGPDHLFELMTCGDLATNLRELSMSHVEAYAPTAHGLYDPLLRAIARSFPSLESLKLVYCDWIASPMVPTWAVPLFDPATPAPVRSMRTLDVFDLDANNCVRFTALAPLFPDLESMRVHLAYADLPQIEVAAQFARLQHLELRCKGTTVPISAEAPTILVEPPPVVGFALSSSALTSLFLWTPPPKSWLLEYAVLPMAPHLTRIVLNYPSTAFTDLVVHAAPVVLGALEHLEVRAIGADGGRNAQRLVRAFTHDAPKLKFLHFEALYHQAAKLDADLVDQLVAKAPRLRALEVQNYAITVEVLDRLRNAPWRAHLHHLELCGAAIEAMDVALLDAVLDVIRAYRALRSLSLSVNRISDPAWDMVLALGQCAARVRYWPADQPVSRFVQRSDSAVDLASTVEEEEARASSAGTGKDLDEAVAAVDLEDPVDKTVGYLASAKIAGERRRMLQTVLARSFPGIESLAVWTKLSCRGLANV